MTHSLCTRQSEGAPDEVSNTHMLERHVLPTTYKLLRVFHVLHARRQKSNKCIISQLTFAYSPTVSVTVMWLIHGCFLPTPSVASREAKFDMKFRLGRLASHESKVNISHDFHFFVTSVVSQPLTFRPIITPKHMSFDKNCRTGALWRSEVFVVLSFAALTGSNLGHENEGNRRPLSRLSFHRHDCIYESGVGDSIRSSLPMKSGFGEWWLQVHKTCDRDPLVLYPGLRIRYY